MQSDAISSHTSMLAVLMHFSMQPAIPSNPLQLPCQPSQQIICLPPTTAPSQPPLFN